MSDQEHEHDGDGGASDGTDETSGTDESTADEPPADEQAFEAAEYASGAVSYPPHPVGPEGSERVGTLDLREFDAEVVTWTTSTATPPGVRQPNTLAIVEFDLGDGYDGPPVRALGQIAEDDGGDAYDVDIGETVEPVYADELRDPDAGIREPESQEWDGFRFRPVE